jgi:hypothetical protein
MLSKWTSINKGYVRTHTRENTLQVEMVRPDAIRGLDFGLADVA